MGFYRFVVAVQNWKNYMSTSFDEQMLVVTHGL